MTRPPIPTPPLPARPSFRLDEPSAVDGLPAFYTTSLPPSDFLPCSNSFHIRGACLNVASRDLKPPVSGFWRSRATAPCTSSSLHPPQPCRTKNIDFISRIASFPRRGLSVLCCALDSSIFVFFCPHGRPITMADIHSDASMKQTHGIIRSDVCSRRGEAMHHVTDRPCIDRNPSNSHLLLS